MVHDPNRDQTNCYLQERWMKHQVIRSVQLSFIPRAGWLFRFPDLWEPALHALFWRRVSKLALDSCHPDWRHRFWVRIHGETEPELPDPPILFALFSNIHCPIFLHLSLPVKKYLLADNHFLTFTADSQSVPLIWVAFRLNRPAKNWGLQRVQKI